MPRVGQAGFTILELMIVVSIIVISAALAGPSISASFQRRRASQASLDLVQLARKARSQSISYGRAFLVRYADASAPQGTLGRMRIFRGTVNNCNANDWDTIIAAGDCGEAGSACIGELNMWGPSYRTESSDVLLRPQAVAALGGLENLDLCYEPNGTMRYRSGASVNGGPFLQDNVVGGAFVFSFQRRTKDAGTTTNAGVTRQVIFPLGSDARVRR